LNACAADTSGVADVRHVSGLATRPECRGPGLGTAVTGWPTRRLLAEFDLVTLGVHADNPVGLRLYDRLGYAADHHFANGLLHRC
jgi:predicted GNAT family acetyltransferase